MYIHFKFVRVCKEMDMKLPCIVTLIASGGRGWKEDPQPTFSLYTSILFGFLGQIY